MDFFNGEKNLVMIKAFVFGKFLPFHKGHEAMIKFALTKCNFLTVLICCSDKETVSGIIRKKWIEETFKGQKNIEVREFNYTESQLPNTSKSSLVVSKIWSKSFKQEFPDYSLVITSEKYGDYVAEFMGIQHILFDIQRNTYQISATAIRNNLFLNWQFLPNRVKVDYAKKIVILGTESTGKTVLSNKLAAHFNCSLVSEAGREIISNSNSFNYSDLLLVAKEHSKQIQNALTGDSPLIIIDTDIHITKSYSKFIFKKELEVSKEIYNSNQANLYLYLNNDVEYEQDGTRLSKENRDLLDKSHRNILEEHKIKFVEIKGNWVQRFAIAVNEIEKLISVK